MSTITAKYPGLCAACGRFHIKTGDTIRSLDQGGWAPVTCPALKQSEVMQRYLVKQAAKRRSNDMRKAAANLDGPTENTRGRCNNDEVVTREHAYFKAHPVDLSWAGTEVFY